MFGALVFMRKVPPRLVKLFPNAVVKKLGGLVCQLVPLFLFYLVVQSFYGIGKQVCFDCLVSNHKPQSIESR